MSMQRIFNYGSTLQAYALGRLIERADASAAVGYLDYRPGPTLIEATDKPSRLGRVMSKLGEYGGIDVPLADKIRFMNHKRSYASRYLSILDLPADPARDTGVDVQVVGSDEVFNCVQSNSNVGYAPDLFGRGSSATRLISYAASFGNTTLERIDRAGIRGELEADFARFDAISVRDRNSADIVEALTGTRPPIHVDPVLAYDFLTHEDRIPARRRDGKYVVVYGYPGRISRAEGEAVAAYAAGLDAEVISIGGIQDGGGRFVDCDPFEVLAFIRDAEAVVTDTFHGTIFSIINGTPFATILRPTVDDGYGNEEKLGYLLETFGLQARRSSEPTDMAGVLDTPLDIAAIGAVLERERERSATYLRESLAVEKGD